MSKELAKEYVTELVKRARKAQESIEDYTQEQVDKLVAAVVWNIVKDGPAQEISKLAVEESKMGNYEGKYNKLMAKAKGAMRDMIGKKSVGVIEVDDEKQIMKIAKPVGVIGALVPCTNPEATPTVKVAHALKGRNAIILSPHPRTKKTNTFIVKLIRETLKRYGAPEDLVIGIENPTMEISNELMKQADLVLATGGAGLVKSAYSSGTPAYGVGAGNAVIVVDETADLNDAAHKIMLSKTFDFATSCSAENSLIIQESIYDEFVEALKAEGGYLANAKEKEKLQSTLWVDGHLNSKIVAQSPQTIANLANIDLPDDRKFIMVEETGIGKDYPFSGEKLSVVVTLYKYNRFEEAINKVNEITRYQGMGHSCGIHSFNEDHIMELALKTKVSRMNVNQGQALANTGNWFNGMPFTTSLGCGTWGGNIVSENITWKHLINTTWVSRHFKPVVPTDEELFGDVMYDDISKSSL
ncbi:aldehyde dehydrogenase family protein [Crassaminicella thermophila]|uniref:Aldehyde dehydrogenase family protein n=1 Tax=Crassaminicella thermophila TaxID=2599308 RepID=A0A5C0SE83_CRATE|nr:aldehyde dehydrogenase family protein [Crassaminicella thermophila]QEK12925.1 aldehyde dehydrogenase family protein [Crassaminicella thermophila]